MQPTAQGIARTYSDRVYPDPWEKVLDYRRVREYSAEHPNAGRVRIGNALDLPSSRVRGWINDSVPDPVRGINTAIQHSWVEPNPNGKIAASLVELLAHVLSGGSISEKFFVPAVAPGKRVEIQEIRQAFESVGVETVTRHEDSKSRSTEVVPANDGSVLGRCLVTMGVPNGQKTKLDRLPPAVWDVPVSVRRSFAQIYLRHRGLDHKQKATTQVQVKRPVSFIKDLWKLLDGVCDGRVTSSGERITISADAARELQID
ncbi:hypothetical protein [Halorubrum yunnanense]|uniref:Uncharacterized protein n=1 Tax=Halorubrum yunnanense TaxID=1526162 RepID=A0ABD5YIG8_9EURY|nr:hypothetical protein [Halorubrum yunnanense]